MMKKGKKRLIIGIGVLAAAAGSIVVLGQQAQQGQVIPQVEVVKAVRGDIQQTVEASGTVVSEEEKTYFSPANAKVQEVSAEEGKVVKAGTKLVKFNLKDLQREEKKASMNLESGKLDMQNTINKSNKAVQKQRDAQGNAAALKQQVEDQKNYVASLKAQIVQATADAQARAAQEAARQEAEAQAAKQAQQQEIQRQYAEAMTVYENETLPDYQARLEELNNKASQALSSYNQAENTYQMAFQVWTADPNDENTAALSQAEELRSEAQIELQNAQTAYEDYKKMQPAPPQQEDFSSDVPGTEFVSDGTELADGASGTEAGSSVSSVTADTSQLEAALEQASSDLAELQSELASQEAVAETDPAAVTEEEKEKMEISNNLSELDQMSAQELVEEAKKGISADFNGVISGVSVVEGATVTQGTELFTLQNTDRVDVDVNISKYDYDKIEKNQKAEITLAGETYQGTVREISHIAAQNEKGATQIPVKVKIDNPDENVFLGVDAKVTIQAKKAEDVIMLPAEVVNIGKEGSFCYVLEDGVIARKNVATGLSSDDYTEILSGIGEGEAVIRDLGTLQEGMQAQAADTGEETGEDA